jgi:prepilin-type N-terminal cleavage/methylation domain-containing protein
MMKLSSKGFTLLELMIVTGILLIVISGLLVTFVYCLLLNESNNNLTIAAGDAQYVLEELSEMKGTQYSQIDEYIASFNPSRFTNLNNETVAFPNPVYGAYTTEVTVNVSWAERGRTRDFAISTRLAP